MKYFSSEDPLSKARDEKILWFWGDGQSIEVVKNTNT